MEDPRHLLLGFHLLRDAGCAGEIVIDFAGLILLPFNYWYCGWTTAVGMAVSTNLLSSVAFSPLLGNI